MGVWWIPALAGGRASFFHALSSFVGVLCAASRRWWLSEDEIRFSPPSPHSVGVLASSKIVWRFFSGGSRGSRSAFVFGGSCLRTSVFFYRLDLSDLRFSSSAAVAILVRWSYEALARDFPTVYYNKVCPAPAREGRRRRCSFGLLLVLSVLP